MVCGIFASWCGSSGGCRQLLLFLYAEGLVREGVVSSPSSQSAIALMSSVNTMSLSSGQVGTFRETLLWPNRIKSDMEAAEKTLNGEKLKLVEELDWRCERFVKGLAELTATAQKVCACVSSCVWLGGSCGAWVFV